MWSAPNAQEKKIKDTDVVVNPNHVTFLTNSFSRLISLPSTTFVSGTSGITAILKYRSVNPIVSTRPLISKSSCPYTNSLVTAQRAPITIGIIVTFMFHSFFNSFVRSRYLSFFSFSLNFTLLSAKTRKSTILQVLSFFVDYS